MADESYENNAAVMAAKILIRPLKAKQKKARSSSKALTKEDPNVADGEYEISATQLTALLSDNAEARIVFEQLEKMIAELGIQFEHGASSKRYILYALMERKHQKPSGFTLLKDIEPLFQNTRFITLLDSVLAFLSSASQAKIGGDEKLE